MTRFKRILAAFAMLLTIAGITVAAQSPASASADNAQCYVGYVCFYEHAGYTGSEYDIWAGGNRGTCVSFGFGFWWDRASSVQNRSGTDVTLYRDAYCGGSGTLWMFNGMNIGDLGAWGWNDTVDAVYIN